MQDLKPTRNELTNYALGGAFTVVAVALLAESNVWEVPATAAAGFTTLFTWVAWKLGLGND